MSLPRPSAFDFNMNTQSSLSTLMSMLRQAEALTMRLNPAEKILRQRNRLEYLRQIAKDEAVFANQNVDELNHQEILAVDAEAKERLAEKLLDFDIKAIEKAYAEWSLKNENQEHEHSEAADYNLSDEVSADTEILNSSEPSSSSADLEQNLSEEMAPTEPGKIAPEFIARYYPETPDCDEYAVLAKLFDTGRIDETDNGFDMVKGLVAEHTSIHLYMDFIKHVAKTLAADFANIDVKEFILMNEPKGAADFYNLFKIVKNQFDLDQAEGFKNKIGYAGFVNLLQKTEIKASYNMLREHYLRVLASENIAFAGQDVNTFSAATIAESFAGCAEEALVNLNRSGGMAAHANEPGMAMLLNNANEHVSSHAPRSQMRLAQLLAGMGDMAGDESIGVSPEILFAVMAQAQQQLSNTRFMGMPLSSGSGTFSIQVQDANTGAVLASTGSRPMSSLRDNSSTMFSSSRQQSSTPQAFAFPAAQRLRREESGNDSADNSNESGNRRRFSSCTIL